jgi:ABC-type antimicrobial peptide transport system permease subunit
VGSPDSACATVVGIAVDVHRVGYREPPSLQYYVPLGQATAFSGLTLVARPPGGGSGGVERLRSALSDADASVDHVEVTRIGSLLDAQIRPWRLGSVVLSLAASLAVLVSAIGVYGVLSYIVAQRRREIGVRMALGASTVSIRALVLRVGLLSGGLGVAAGVGLVLAASRWLEPLLFETETFDPAVIAGVTTLLVSAAVLACVLPAGQAARVDPVEALAGDG